MTINTKQKTLIGRAESVEFPSLNGVSLHARIDTGAKTSSIWATDIKKDSNGALVVRFASPGFAINEHEVVFDTYDIVRIASSMGHLQDRYKVKMPIRIGGRQIMASFTLADRSTQVYPVLIGRSTLLGKFIVDVSGGVPLTEEEKRRSAELQASIEGEK